MYLSLVHISRSTICRRLICRNNIHVQDFKSNLADVECKLAKDLLARVVHLANLNMHLPPLSHSAAPPGFAMTPATFSGRTNHIHVALQSAQQHARLERGPELEVMSSFLRLSFFLCVKGGSPLRLLCTGFQG